MRRGDVWQGGVSTLATFATSGVLALTLTHALADTSHTYTNSASKLLADSLTLNSYG